MQAIARAAIVVVAVPIALISSSRHGGAVPGGLSHEAHLQIIEDDAAVAPGRHFHRDSIVQKRSNNGHNDLEQRLLGSDESYEHVGCYVDIRFDRVLEFGFYSGAMTNELCYEHCGTTGAPVMGLQFGYECWCGFQPAAVFIVNGIGTCDSYCAGDSSMTCGGNLAFDLYHINHQILEQPGPTAPSPASASTEEASTSSPSVAESATLAPLVPLLYPVTDSMAVLLDLHNDARCIHGVEPLQYSDDVTAAAEGHAERLTNDANCGTLFHSDNNGYGENIYMCWTTGFSECYTPEGAMVSLYGTEVDDGPVSGYGLHATQILWQSTTELGCAVERCTTPDAQFAVLVCNYNPPGNYMTELEDEVEVPSRSAEECETGIYDTTTIPTPTPDTASSSTSAGGSPDSSMCETTPCLNGGTCFEDSENGRVCSCPPDFGGMDCQTDTSDLPKFYITVDFIGTWTRSRKDVFERAANRWAEVITHVPCGGTTDYPSGQLFITATLTFMDGVNGILGSAGPTSVWESCPTISFNGQMEFDIDDIARLESDDTFEGVILHEMGHVIGVGTLWGDCSTCQVDNDPEWKCPSAARAYNELMGNDAGTAANIIELEGGGGTACGHFSEDDFDNELMTGLINLGEMPLSKITIASLDDTGYIVDATAADDYIIPAKRPPSIRSSTETKFELNDRPSLDTSIAVVDDDGHTVGHIIDGVRFRF